MTFPTSRALNVFAAAAALACAGSAFAQSTYNPSDYILLNGSAVKPDSKYPTDKVGPGGGIKFGMPISPDLDLQFGGNYGQSRDHGSVYHQWTAGIDALYLLTPGGFRPFILGGVGVVRDSSSNPLVGSFRRTSPYAQVGAGFQYKITPTLGLQADVRELGSFYNKRVVPYDMKHSFNTYADVGLTWAFGAAPAPAPAPIVPVAPPPPAPAPVVMPPPPPPAPLPPPAPVMKKYTLSASELFAFNSAKLGPNQPKLDEVAAVMNANNDIASVTIVGYTDRIGSRAYNQKLSEERANSVKAYLQGKGISSSRLTAVGKGENDPVVECKDEKKRPALIKCLEPNRRVEIEPVTFTKQVN
jgi:OmpA-OmpF porin, OOP family